MRQVIFRAGFILAVMVFLNAPASYSATYLGPTAYLSAADSPFTGSFSYFYRETFESGALNTPGVTASGGGILNPNSLTDSVDKDDGLIDGLGQNGYSWYSANNRSLTFTFNQGVLGKLPTHAGIVWTDVGFSDGITGYGQVSFEGFDQNSVSLGIILPFNVGDGAFQGQTAEDRFLGIINPGGISKITISMNSTDWEVDHLQYGAAAPLPPSALLLGSSLLGLVGWRRFRQS